MAISGGQGCSGDSSGGQDGEGGDSGSNDGGEGGSAESGDGCWRRKSAARLAERAMSGVAERVARVGLRSKTHLQRGAVTGASAGTAAEA